MNVNFILEGENLGGDFLQSEVEFENVESFEEACALAEKEAIEILNEEGGGHIDIYEDGENFVNFVEV